MRREGFLLMGAIMIAPAIAGATSIYTEYCRQHPDGDLPTDPRTLATEMNGFTSRWMSCHEEPIFATCGEWLAAVAEGERILEEEAMVGSLISAETYAGLWRAWGLSEPPSQAEFEARVRERYGLQPAPFDNPYPLPGGGTGQLPMGLIQTRDNGNYDGRIGLTCLACHAGRVAGQSIVGLGNNTLDFGALLQDILAVGNEPLPVTPPIFAGQTRGSVDADYGFAVLQSVRDFDTLDPTPFVKPHLLAIRVGDQDPPNWWNKGSRPRLLFDGGEPADNTRTFMAFLMADTSASGEEIKAWEPKFEKIYAYLDAIEPPPYPQGLPFDSDAAARGKIVFHTRNLFPNRTPPVGNGSCSSCHGIHAEEYANDPTVGNGSAVQPAFVSGQIIPQEVVGTDPERLGGLYLGSLGNSYRWQYSTMWWSFVDNSAKDGNPITEGMNDYNTKEANTIAGGRVEGECKWEQEHVGYAAPPLLGVWASAPYFHNGSVPTVWGVLDPASRPEYWRRQLSNDALTGSEQGFDTSLAAYDPMHLGWKYEVVTPAFADPTGLGIDRPVYQAGFGFFGAPWAPGSSQVEERKIYNTHLFGKSNQGHVFTADLSPEERKDLIEFLKTL